MKRHTAEGEPPEAAVEYAYGSCIHDVFEAIEKGGLDDDAACQLAFDKWGGALAPEDLQQLKDDIAVYRQREVIGVRTLANESEFRVPLMQRNCPKCDGRGASCKRCKTTGKITIYFRFRLDRLYQMRDNAAIFLHIDYKSSTWRKTEKEIHKNLQMWAYNWGIHEFFPECEQLFQRYDQLRYGYITTQKSAQRRELMGEWLRRQVTAILNDEDYGQDDLLLPRFNQWCPWCFPASQKILLPGGTTRAISEVNTGDEILGADGKPHRVIAKASRRADRGLLRIRTLGAPSFKATPDHPVLAGPEREWTPAESLSRGDLIWGRLPSYGKRRSRLTQDELTLLGWYLAEGHAGQRSVSFSLHADEVAEQEEIARLMGRVFGVRHTEVQRQNLSVQSYFHDHLAASWFRHFGGKMAAGKRIHPLVFGDGSDLMPLVVAAWRGDGTTPHPDRTQLSYTTSSLTLASQLQIALFREGLCPSWGTKEAHQFHKKATELGFRQTAYTLTLNGIDASEMARHLGGQTRPPLHQKLRIARDGEWVGYPIMEIESIESEEEVFDLQVRDSESFMLPGLVGVHNCPIMESCTVIDRLSDFAQSRIAALAPDAVSVARVGLDATEIETYVERLESVGTAKKVLEGYEETVKALIRKLPTSERKRLGWRLSDRRADAWDADAMREAHAILGDDFYALVGITKRRLDSLFDDDPRADQVRNLARKEITGDQLRRMRG